MNRQVTSQSLLMSDKFINMNCNDRIIVAAVDQQIIEVQNNNPSFFTTKTEEICPHLGKYFQIKIVVLKLQWRATRKKIMRI